MRGRSDAPAPSSSSRRLQIHAAHTRRTRGRARVRTVVGRIADTRDWMRMEPFDLNDLDAQQRWDAFASGGAPSGIDTWCSRPTWSLAVHHAFADLSEDPGPPVGFLDDDGIGTFGRVCTAEGDTALVPLDRVWGFASPIVCTVGCERRVAANVAAALLAEPDWKICVLTGMTEGSALFEAVVEGFGRHLALYGGESRVRCQASLDDGIDGYLQRRSREHRRNLRQADRHVEALEDPLTYDIADTAAPASVTRRLHAVEMLSWKGLDGSGIESPDMARLYEQLVTALSTRGALRCVFVRQRGEDVGFILGGVLGDTYRGLQISFVENVRTLSIGNLLQWHEIQRSCAEGLRTYDLGMDIAYKRRWAESQFETTSVIAVRR